VSELPYPFRSPLHLEVTLRSPLGPEWTPRRAHELLTRPRVTTDAGAIITPLRADRLKVAVAPVMPNGGDGGDGGGGGGGDGGGGGGGEEVVRKRKRSGTEMRVEGRRRSVGGGAGE
ncbi:unnamed protein product, partial [Lampetra fluviatilis]